MGRPESDLLLLRHQFMFEILFYEYSHLSSSSSEQVQNSALSREDKP